MYISELKDDKVTNVITTFENIVICFNKTACSRFADICF